MYYAYGRSMPTGDPGHSYVGVPFGSILWFTVLTASILIMSHTSPFLAGAVWYVVLAVVVQAHMPVHAVWGHASFLDPVYTDGRWLVVGGWAILLPLPPLCIASC